MQHEVTNAHGELGALTDSLSSVVRWRYADYEGFLRKQLTMLAEQQSIIDYGDGVASVSVRVATADARFQVLDGFVRQ